MENGTFGHFIGREAELRQLINALENGAESRGGIYFVSGNAGMGKTALLTELQKRAAQISELKKGIFFRGYCDEDISEENAYQPFAEIVAQITEQQSKMFRPWLLQFFKELAPDLLNFIPGIGPIIGVSVKGAIVAGEILPSISARHQSSQAQNQLTDQFVYALFNLAREKPLLVLIIEDAHWIDDASCQLIYRLSRRLTTEKIVVILSYRPRLLQANHSLLKVKSRLEKEKGANAIHLKGFTTQELRSYLHRRFGTILHEYMVRWLEQITGGDPLFVVQHLSLLEDDLIIYKDGDRFRLRGDLRLINGELKAEGDLGRLKISTKVETVIQERIQRLKDEERDMLEMGSVQGISFQSAILADHSTRHERDILAQLRRVAERHRVISLAQNYRWYPDKSDVYVFEHALMHRAFYDRLTPGQRLLYHNEVAKILAMVLTSKPQADRKLLLDLAHHYEHGGQSLLAGEVYFDIAQEMYANGVFVETRRLCQHIINLLRIKESNQEHDRLLSHAVLLFMICSLDSEGRRSEQLKLLELSKLGIEAAKRTHDKSTLAKIKVIQGGIIVHLGDMPKALSTMKEAYALALETGNPMAEAVVAMHLGSHLAKVDLAEAIRLRYRALDIYKEQRDASGKVGEIPTVLRYEIYTTVGSLSIHEFDQANFDKAQKLAERAWNGLKQLNMQEDLVWVGNYLAQIYLASGQFERAESILREVLSLFQGAEIYNAWTGYNWALLGKVYLEWEQIERASEPLARGAKESEWKNQADLLGIVRNYYAELLMHPEYKKRDLKAAAHLLELNISSTKTAGLIRSTVPALSLRARLALEQSSYDDALQLSSEAVQFLEEYNTLPAVRSEEIFFYHYLVLSSLNQEREAIEYLDKALKLITLKSRSIAVPDSRHNFLNRIPLNLQIKQHHHKVHPP
jgi:predicted ATPase